MVGDGRGDLRQLSGPSSLFFFSPSLYSFPFVLYLEILEHFGAFSRQGGEMSASCAFCVLAITPRGLVLRNLHSIPPSLPGHPDKPALRSCDAGQGRGLLGDAASIGLFPVMGPACGRPAL